MRIVLRKSTVRPWPSVSRPSSSTCSSTSKTSGCAFSTSSSSTTLYGRPPHRLGELAALLVADVAGRRADQPGDRVLLAVLAHVDADHRPLVVEQEVGQRLGQLGLADAGRAEEEEGAGGAVGVGRRPPGPGAPRRRPPARRSAWPISRLPSSSSIRSSLPVSPSSSRPAGMPVQADDHVGDVVRADLLLDHRRGAQAWAPASGWPRRRGRSRPPRRSPRRGSGSRRRAAWRRSRSRRRAGRARPGPVEVVEPLLQLADPVEARLLLLPAGGQPGAAAPAGRRGRRGACPAAPC